MRIQVFGLSAFREIYQMGLTSGSVANDHGRPHHWVERAFCQVGRWAGCVAADTPPGGLPGYGHNPKEYGKRQIKRQSRESAMNPYIMRKVDEKSTTRLVTT